jgi:hypothetical protein
VHRSPNETEAADRARWLAELAVAIDEAQRLAWQLGGDGVVRGEIRELYGRLEVLRAELDSLRRSGWATCREEIEPSWINFFPRDGTSFQSAG